MFELEGVSNRENMIVAVSDTHIGSVGHAEIDDYIDIVRLKDKYPRVSLFGDVVDMTNCKKRLVGHYLMVIQRLMEHFKDRYVKGNHESMKIGTGYDIEIVNGRRVLKFHGPGVYINEVYHPIYYSEKQTIKWENHKLGRGRWSAWKYRVWRKFSRHKGGWKQPSDYILYRISDIMDLLSCTVAIWGHTHRSFDSDRIELPYELRGKRFINVPKGISYIEV